MPVKNGKGPSASGGRSRAHSLAPHRPSPVTSAGGLPGSLPCPPSGPPCAWTPGEATRSGSSLRLDEHPGFSHNSRPLGRAALHRSAHDPAACVPAPQSLDFFFFFVPPTSLFVRWQIWVFFLVSFLSFSLPFSFPWSTREARGGGVLESFRMSWGCGYRRPAAGTVWRGLPVSLSGPRVPCWLSPGARPSVPSLLAQSSARLSPAPAARSLLLAVG